MSAKDTNKQIDWESIEKDWRAGIKTKLQMSEEHDVSRAAMDKRFKKLGIERDLSEKIRQGKVVLRAEEDELVRPGFVYGVYLDDSSSKRYYKIGMAGAFTPRFQAHQCASPFEICVAFAYYVGDMRLEERFLHSRFAACRIRGEWFSLSKEDLEEISKRALLV